MTAEQFVKSKLPKATAERQVTNGGNVYYLIRDGRATLYLAEGATKKLAWENAKKHLTNFKEAIVQNKSPENNTPVKYEAGN